MFKTAPRVFETSITTGVGTYTLDGAQTGFQSFATGIGNGNTCEFFVTDDTNWEEGIGTVLTGPNRLERTVITGSSNGGAPVNWGIGTRKIRVGKIATLATTRALSKSIAGTGTTILTADEQRNHIITFTGILTGNRIIEFDATPWDCVIKNETSGNFTLTVRVTGQTGEEFFQGRAARAICNGTDIIKVGDHVPPGTMLDFGGGTLPAGFLACDGSNVSRATYAGLFNKVGTTHGVGDGSTTFGLPDERRKVRVGSGGAGTATLGNGVGQTGGAETHTLVTGELASHTHTGPSHSHGAATSTENGTHTHSGTTASENASHTHSYNSDVSAGGASAYVGGAQVITGQTGTQSANHQHTVTTGTQSANHTHTINADGTGATGGAGSGTAHNNMQPSIVTLKMIKT